MIRRASDNTDPIGKARPSKVNGGKLEVTKGSEMALDALFLAPLPTDSERQRATLDRTLLEPWRRVGNQVLATGGLIAFVGALVLAVTWPVGLGLMGIGLAIGMYGYRRDRQETDATLARRKDLGS